jgi:hypothetical protein
MSSFLDLKVSRFRWLAVLLCAFACHPSAAATVGFRTRELPWAAFASPYRVLIETFVDGRCVDGGIGFSTVSGALPRGLELRGGSITGSAEELGAFHFRLQVTNGCGVDERDFVLQVTGRPILRVSPEAVEMEYHIGGPLPEANLLVSATWPQFPYFLTNGSETWLRVRQRAGVTPLPGSPYAGDAVQLEIVPEKLTPGTYESILVFSGPQGAAPWTVPVRLNVVAAAAGSIPPAPAAAPTVAAKEGGTK